MQKSAVVSSCGRHRYVLMRDWDAAAGRVVFVMLNPSTADAELDDPTIRRCVGYARAWGYGSIAVVNLFTFRATEPADLWSVPASQRNGPEADAYFSGNVRSADLVVFAWGAAPQASARARWAMAETRAVGKVGHALRLTKAGHPAHPLYLPASLTPVAIDVFRKPA